MKLAIFFLVGTTLLFSSCQSDIKKEKANGINVVHEISFYTPDSIKIFGDLYELDKEGSTILLFHQGGFNARGEYASIIPKLIERKFNVLAIDQRMGGQA
jgi:pimeloyl-ACP methyl ester carboxylesterase